MGDSVISPTRPTCIPGCTANHDTQPATLQECSARDSVGTLRNPADRSVAYVSTTRWQDNAGVDGEVVLYSYTACSDEDPDPLTFTPAQARNLAIMLNHAAELVEVTRPADAR